MLQVSREHPQLTAMVVPSPITFTWDATVINILKAGSLGDLVYVEVRAVLQRSSSLVHPFPSAL